MTLQTKQLEVWENPSLPYPNLHFIFKGKFTKEASEQGCKAWIDYFKSKSSSTFTIIWDCTNMSGFELEARKQWYVGLTQTKSQIEQVVIVSNNLMIRASARVMCSFFGLKGKFVKSLEELNVEV